MPWYLAQALQSRDHVLTAAKGAGLLPYSSERSRHVCIEYTIAWPGESTLASWGGAYPKKKLKKGRTPVNIIVNITLYNVKGSVRADQERLHRPFFGHRVTLFVLSVTLLCTECHPFVY